MRLTNTILNSKSPISSNFRNIVDSSISLSFKILGKSVTPATSPFIILHELLGSKKQWKGIGKTLGHLTQRSVVAVDLRNHGDSPHTSTHSYKELAEDMLFLINKLATEKVILIGHGMGGRAAMCVSLLKPEKVEKIIAVDISPVSSSPKLIKTYPIIMEGMKAMDFTKVATRNISKAREFAKRKLDLIIKDEYTMGVVLDNINVLKDGKIGWACNLDVLIKNFDNIAYFPNKMKEKRFNGPTLFLAGANSDFIPPNDESRIKDTFPHSNMKYIDASGHKPHIDNPKTFMESIINFVKA